MNRARCGTKQFQEGLEPGSGAARLPRRSWIDELARRRGSDAKESFIFHGPFSSWLDSAKGESRKRQWPTLKKLTAFDLPGPAGKRFDYLTIDEDDHYLISAHLAAEQTYVIDLQTNRIVAVVTDTPGVEGVEYVPELKKFYTSNAHDDTDWCG